MEMWDGGSGSGSNTTYNPIIHIKEEFTIMLRKDITGRWLAGKCYKDQIGKYYHPETATAGILKGDLKVVESFDFYSEYR